MHVFASTITKYSQGLLQSLQPTVQVFLDLRVIIIGSREESGSNSRADQAGGVPSETREDTSNALGQGEGICVTS